MLSVFICEDEEPVREAEREYLEKQILMKGYDMEVVCCTGCPEEVLEVISGERGRRSIFWMWN